MNILSIDYGKKNIGLAWAQDELGVVLPFGRIAARDTRGAIAELVDLIKNENIDKIVIGMPFGLDGGENKNTKRVMDFAKQLKDKAGLDIEFIDERYTSAQADNMGGEVSRDEKAAMIILNNYLDGNRI